MRVILADLCGDLGFVSKDTVAGGYGSRFLPFSRTTRIYHRFKRRVRGLPSIQMAYIAAILKQQGHEVCWTQGEQMNGDLALVLSSLVDYRTEVAWAATSRAKGIRVGFVGLASSALPDLFAENADFIISGEPESAVLRLAKGETLTGICNSSPVDDLESLPFPQWDFKMVPKRSVISLLASRGCREHCTYCPHRIASTYRCRSVKHVADELQQLCAQISNPYVIFRDALFASERDWCVALCDEILRRRLRLRFECETRLDCLDESLLRQMRRAGLRRISFGVESLMEESLQRIGRRSIPAANQRSIIDSCRRLDIHTMAYYMIGLLQDTWDSVAATIIHAISLGSTFAQFKLITPYPGTPFWQQIRPLIYETNWEKFDGYTPTFKHPNLSASELRYLLGAAYARFYTRPSFLLNYLNIEQAGIRRLVEKMDAKCSAAQARKEMASKSRCIA